MNKKSGLRLKRRAARKKGKEKMKIYTIYDVKAQQYHLPYYAPTDGVAIRTLEQAMSEPNTLIATNPEDFMLFRLGEFDPDKGEIKTQAALCVIKAIELVKPKDGAFLPLGYKAELIEGGN